MTRDAELLGKIFEITRGDLDIALFPHPRIGLAISGLSFVRIARISRFWDKNNDERLLLEQCAEDLITGLFGQSCSWMFLLKGLPTAIECWFGISKAANEAALNTYLAGAFPDIRIDSTQSIEYASFDDLRFAHVLTGTPSPKTDLKNESRADQIEKLCRGLYGGHWVYAVYAEPIPSVQTVKLINDIAQEVRSVYSTYMLKASATDERNRLAQRYVELLEARLKRFEQGRTSGMWSSYTMLLTGNAPQSERAQALLCSAFSGDMSLPDPVRIRQCSRTAAENPALEPLTSKEISILARPPREEYPGYEVVDYTRFGVVADGLLGLWKSGTIKIGDICDRGMLTGNSLHVPIRDLTKHGLIVGVTGSGKTNTCLNLLDQIWNAGKGIPFLVVESAKSEYRALIRNPRFKGVKVFTVGDETTSPFRLNPFEVPVGILVQAHIDYLKSLFSAAFVLYPPMPYVLEQSIQEIYEDRGWDLARNINNRGNSTHRIFPSLSDLTAKIAVVVDRMGYDERITMDVKAGLLARINQLRLGGGKGLMLNTRKSLDSSILFASPCIFELKQIVSDDEKAFIIGLILIRLHEYHEARPRHSNGEISHVTLIEEAHRLLRNVSTEQGGEVSANPKGRAIEVFANILSEIRAYGEGILIAEQIPTKLTPDAIKNTNLKIVHRLVAEDDRKAIGTTMNLHELQLRYLTTLKTGEAVAYTEGMQKSVLLTVPFVSPKIAVTNEEVKNDMNYFWNENQDVYRMFSGCTNCRSDEHYCSFKPNSRPDVLSLEAFSRLLNTLRLNKALVFDAFSDFKLSCQRDPWYQHAHSEYCVFQHLLERDLERHGEYSAWPHEEVDKAIRLACSVMSKLVCNFGKIDKKSLEKECSKDLTAFSSLFKRLCKIQVVPFPGCRFCCDPCSYRYDMQCSADNLSVSDFRSGFMDPEIQMDELASICWNLTAHAFFPKDIRSRRGAALCFAIQQFSGLGLSRINQEDMADQTAHALGDFGGNA